MHLNFNDFHPQDLRPTNPKLRNGPFFVMLSRTGCGHCKNALPAFESLQSPIPSFIVDSASKDPQEKKLAEAIQLWMGTSFSGYPTFILFKPNGDMIECKVNRTVQAWSSWLDANQSS